MRRKAIKHILFSVVSIVALRVLAQADLTEDIMLVDELPLDARVIVHREVANYFDQHPDIAPNAKIISIDRKGTVYVLDENKITIGKLGAPTCYRRSDK